MSDGSSLQKGYIFKTCWNYSNTQCKWRIERKKPSLWSCLNSSQMGPIFNEFFTHTFFYISFSLFLYLAFSLSLSLTLYHFLFLSLSLLCISCFTFSFSLAIFISFFLSLLPFHSFLPPSLSFCCLSLPSV